MGLSVKYFGMSFTLISYILIWIGHNILLWMWYIKISWWTSIIKTYPIMGAVICNCCQNCSTVRSHDPFQGIIPNNIHWTIEIVHDQRMLTNNARVCVTVMVCLLLFVICQDCINSHGLDNGSDRSFTKNYLPCQWRVLLLVVGVAVHGASGAGFMTDTSADNYKGGGQKKRNGGSEELLNICTIPRRNIYDQRSALYKKIQTRGHKPA